MNFIFLIFFTVINVLIFEIEVELSAERELMARPSVLIVPEEHDVNDIFRLEV